jgi:hypothetical protein
MLFRIIKNGNLLFKPKKKLTGDGIKKAPTFVEAFAGRTGTP